MGAPIAVFLSNLLSSVAGNIIQENSGNSFGSRFLQSAIDKGMNKIHTKDKIKDAGKFNNTSSFKKIE